MYRMRSIGALFDDHHELENQEIFFSDPKNLNDPMEGFIDFFWQGDRVIWRNFLRHYLLCLEQVLLVSGIVTDEQTIGIGDIPIMKTIDLLPTDQYRKVFADICERFFSDPPIGKLVDLLDKRQTPIKREELLFYLRIVHFKALDVVLRSHRAIGFGPKEIPKEFSQIDIGKVIDPILENLSEFEKDTTLAQTMFEVFASLNRQQFLNIATKEFDVPRSSLKRFLLFEFPEAFVERVRELAYPNAYVACFLENCTNAALWGYYADNHKGLCLKFRERDVDGKKALRLNTIAGWGGGPIPGKIDFRFEKVDYVKAFQGIDFFTSLGRLPLAKVDRYWFSEPDGSQSKVVMPYSRDPKTWHAEYWKAHQKSLTTKLEDWKLEEEQRLVLADPLSIFQEDRNRRIRYDFEELEGIVFGYRTTVSDKVRTIRLIREKCATAGRKDFLFYQATYAGNEGRMRIDPLKSIGIDA